MTRRRSSAEHPRHPSWQRQRRHRQRGLCEPHPVADPRSIPGSRPSRAPFGPTSRSATPATRRSPRQSTPTAASSSSRASLLGLASSFFDFYSSPIVTYFATNSEDTGDGGWRVAAYTANFGNGFTATVSLEEPRRLGIVNTAFAFALTGAVSVNSAGTASALQTTNGNPFVIGGGAALFADQTRSATRTSS